MTYYAEGIDAKYFVKTEATYDTVQAFAATDAVGMIELNLEAMKEYHLSKERVGSPSAQSMIAGMRNGKFTAQINIKPNGAGVAADAGELFKAAMGTETVSGGTSVTYSLDSTAPGSLQLARAVGSGLYEIGNGCWVEQMDIEVQANSEPTVSFSGGLATFGFIYGTTVNTNAALGASTVYYATAQKGNIAKNVRIKFGTEDNGGSGYLVTAVDDTATPPALTISPVLVAGVTAGDVIAPVVPSSTLAGTLLGGISGNLAIDSVDVAFRSFKLSAKTGIHARDKEATSDRPVSLFRGQREITGEIQFTFADTATAIYAGRAWAGTNRALVLRIGANTAAQRCKVNVPAAFFETVPIEVQEADEALFSMKFRALQSAAANDELTVVFD